MFFKIPFLLANNNISIILKILFLTFENANIVVVDQKLIRKIYIVVKILLTTWLIKIINQFFCAKLVLNKNSEKIPIYIAILETLKMIIYLSQII